MCRSAEKIVEVLNQVVISRVQHFTRDDFEFVCTYVYTSCCAVSFMKRSLIVLLTDAQHGRFTYVFSGITFELMSYPGVLACSVRSFSRHYVGVGRSTQRT